MSGNFNGLNVQVLDSANAYNGINFPVNPQPSNRQIGVYCMDDNLHHLLETIINAPHNGNAQSKSLSVSSPMDNVLFHRDKFEVYLDAKGYAPEEISCTVLSQYIEVSAKKPVNSCELVGKSMSRKYALPQPVVPEQSRCVLTCDGVLIIAAPWKPNLGQCRYIQV